MYTLRVIYTEVAIYTEMTIYTEVAIYTQVVIYPEVVIYTEIYAGVAYFLELLTRKNEGKTSRGQLVYRFRPVYLHFYRPNRERSSLLETLPGLQSFLQVKTDILYTIRSQLFLTSKCILRASSIQKWPSIHR